MGSSNSKIIVFVGPCGCGKSQFIDCLTGTTKWTNHRMTPDDHPVRSVKAQKVLLVDTPGFDDYNKRAEDIVREVETWMKENGKKKVAGILYLQNIQENRWTKPPPRDILEKLNAKHLVFITTHWDLIGSKEAKQQEAQRREGQIQDRLRSFLKAGARTDRFDKSAVSAWRIIESL